MKSICHIVWLLVALLVVGTLDNVPDPLASSPSKYLHHDHVAVVVPFSSTGLPQDVPVRSFARDAVKSLLYNGRYVLVECASDPSPPSLRLSV